MILGWGEGLTHCHWKQCRHELYIIDNAEFFFFFWFLWKIMLSLIYKLVQEEIKKWIGMKWKKKKLEYFLFFLSVSFSRQNEIYFLVWEFKWKWKECARENTHFSSFLQFITSNFYSLQIKRNRMEWN